MPLEGTDAISRNSATDACCSQNFTHVHELLSPSSGTVDEETPLQTTPLKVPRVVGRIASLVALPDQSVSVNAPETLKITLKETGVEADKIA